MDTLEKTFAMIVLNISLYLSHVCHPQTLLLDNLFENAELNVCWFFWNKMTADYMYTLISFT